MICYESLLNSRNTSSAQELYQIFWNEVVDTWIKEYTSVFPKHGEIFQQTFEGYAFLIDFVWDYMAEADTSNELPGSRVISFFGISNTNIKASFSNSDIISQ
jgi:hypothetical protein